MSFLTGHANVYSLARPPCTVVRNYEWFLRGAHFGTRISFHRAGHDRAYAPVFLSVSLRPYYRQYTRRGRFNITGGAVDY